MAQKGYDNCWNVVTLEQLDGIITRAAGGSRQTSLKGIEILDEIRRLDMREESTIKGALYRIWCGVNRLDDSGV